ncbi:DUF4374 domain-containing protein [Flavivirga sp. 57AJ16]|uniref:DUF4374 domain-containing protein n=1 Tax=Flavivirga sp. 57AJ16 TaxID=3025307 RepID=UPI002367093C|nr:DUF4374 domain-containing protein [Flavivirga sp. 57AJ16]MDD7888127.1 DUF4374 domain-containing protein [Flavivirga sp. 57AJ16]
MKNTNLYSTLLLAVSLISCSNDNSPVKDSEEETTTFKYLITATPRASEGVADYILTTDDLTQGTISTVGNGIEQDGTWRYYATSNNKFFSFAYDDTGAVTTYQLNSEGELVVKSDFQLEAVHTYGPVSNDMLMLQVSRNIDTPYAKWFRLDMEILQIVGEGQINTAELAGNGELAFFTGVTQVGSKVYLPYMYWKSCCNDVYGTNYPDEANIAVYSYPEMELETIIHDDRTSQIGRYFWNGLTEDEKGDTYAFSSAITKNNGESNGTKPSAILKINKGQTTFDENYFFNLEEASNGYYLGSHIYIGNGKFIGIMSEKTSDASAWASGSKYAILDVSTKAFTWVSGMPEPSTIERETLRNNYVIEDNIAYVGVTTNGDSYVYVIDVDKATATQGLKVEGGGITTISKLEVSK